jgi:Rad3-related DNA helicase
MKTFAELGVADDVAETLASHGIISPFPIQSLAIPLAIKGHDLIGQARTGTGKTMAFTLPLLHLVTPSQADGKPQALVVVPTRELASQVARDVELANGSRNVRVMVIYGGRAYEPQLEALRKGVDIVVGTPGRLLDLAKQRALDLSGIRALASCPTSNGSSPSFPRPARRCCSPRRCPARSSRSPAATSATPRTSVPSPPTKAPWSRPPRSSSSGPTIWTSPRSSRG